jgi:hypothetical protein
MVRPNNDIYGCDTTVFEKTYDLVGESKNKCTKTTIVSAKRLDQPETIITADGAAFGKT